jgi:hypothetical protein
VLPITERLTGERFRCENGASARVRAVGGSMTSRFALGWIGIAFLLAGTSCSHSPESFCKSWVEDTCTTIAGCCTRGTTFDEQQCRLSLSATCDDGTAVEKVHSGEVVFDNGAANECFSSPTACSDLQTAANDTSFDHVKACANVLTGFRPVGAACDKSSDCEKAGEFTACYDGTMGGNSGVCAKVVLDEVACSFSFDTNELHICQDGTFCDLSGFKASATDPPTIRQFEFTAKCKNDIQKNGVCLVNGENVPCAEGLFCDLTAKGTCALRKNKGATCTGDGQCADGLECKPNSTGTTQTCQVQGGPYCFSVAKCGDGACNGTETHASCPQDCKAAGCNDDGNCDPGETPANCPGDCGTGTCNFDGLCNTGETPASCPSDCQTTGTCNDDGFCDPGETDQNCPFDCTCNFDGNCDDNESPQSCPSDC